MIDKEQISLNKKYWWDRHSCLSYCVPKEGFGNEGCWVFPLVTMLQRGNVEKILVAHGFNRGKNEYKEIKL